MYYYDTLLHTFTDERAWHDIQKGDTGTLHYRNGELHTYSVIGVYRNYFGYDILDRVCVVIQMDDGEIKNLYYD